MTLNTGSLLLAFSLALGAGAGAAVAADAPKGDGAVAEACKADVEKLCPGIQPGEGRVVACLKEHKKDVSKGCKTEIVKQRKAHKAG